MAAPLRLFATFVVLFLTLHSAFSADPPESSPSPAPETAADAKSPPPATPPASSPPDSSSPPAHPPSTKASESPSPLPAPETLEHHPSPSPSPAADSGEASPSPSTPPSADSTVKDTPEKESSGGMSGAKKAGIAVGVLIGVGVVVLAGIIYKKRQDNVQRSQYGYATRAGLI